MGLQDYTVLFLRRKWVIIFSFLFIFLGASIYCVVVPELYKSSSTILLVPQRVPENYVRSTVSIRIEDRLPHLQQQIMSRTNLMKTADELGLFKQANKTLSAEETVAMMRKRIEIQVRSRESFTVSFIHEDPRLAMLTTSKLVSFFIEETLRAQEQQAVGTAEFLESQLRETKAKLEAAEEKLKRYKMRYAGELPQEVEANLSMLARLQDQLRSNSDAIRSAEDRRILLDAQIAAIQRTTQAVAPAHGGSGRVPAVAGSVQHLLAERAAQSERVAQLSARYTDRYPELIQARRELHEIDRRISEMRRNLPQMDNAASRVVDQQLVLVAENGADLRELARLRAQLGVIESELTALRRENGDIRKNIALIQARIDRAPLREQEMISITRDYENLRRSYDELMRNKLSAEMSKDLENRQKGEQFDVIDPADLPQRPFKPDRRKILAMAVLIAFVIGFGGAIALEALDPTLAEPSDFANHFDFLIFATIPILRDGKYVKMVEMRRYAVIGGMIVFMIIASVFLFNYGDRIRTILLY